MATRQVIYSDIPVNFDVHPLKGDLIRTTNEDAVKRSIRNLLLTDPYERFFNPKIGAGIRASLFENIGQDTEFLLKTKITETINNYEKRAQLYSVKVKAFPDQNAYNASIVFYLVNYTTPITLDLVLRRIR
jgi:phage baseplate assembly protein W